MSPPVGISSASLAPQLSCSLLHHCDTWGKGMQHIKKHHIWNNLRFDPSFLHLYSLFIHNLFVFIHVGNRFWITKGRFKKIWLNLASVILSTVQPTYGHWSLNYWTSLLIKIYGMWPNEMGVSHPCHLFWLSGWLGMFSPLHELHNALRVHKEDLAISLPLQGGSMAVQYVRYLQGQK